MTNEVIKNAIRLIQMEIRANGERGNKLHPKRRRQLNDALTNLKLYILGEKDAKSFSNGG